MCPTSASLKQSTLLKVKFPSTTQHDEMQYRFPKNARGRSIAQPQRRTDCLRGLQLRASQTQQPAFSSLELGLRRLLTPAFPLHIGTLTNILIICSVLPLVLHQDGVTGAPVALLTNGTHFSSSLSTTTGSAAPLAISTRGLYWFTNYVNSMCCLGTRCNVTI